VKLYLVTMLRNNGFYVSGHVFAEGPCQAATKYVSNYTVRDSKTISTVHVGLASGESWEFEYTAQCVPVVTLKWIRP
jgi:hypothetical protein